MKIAILVFALGFCAGMLVNELLLYLKKSSGTLQIDRTNPNKDVYRLAFNELDNLPKKKFVILKVDPNADLSRE